VARKQHVTRILNTYKYLTPSIATDNLITGDEVNFIEKLANATHKNNSLLCVGLDPDPQLMPRNTGVFEFNQAIIEATSDLVCAYKLNLAFYEALDDGLDALKRTIEGIPDEIPVIGDHPI